MRINNLLFLFGILLLVTPFVMTPGCAVSPDDDDDDAADDDVADDDVADDDAADDDAADDDAADDDAADDDTADVGCDDGNTIYEIQGGSIAVDSQVELNCVVVTSQLTEAPPGFFVQEPDTAGAAENSGIYVYVGDDGILGDLAPMIAVGNSVSLKALYSEYYDFSELTIATIEDIELVGTDTVTPAAIADACSIGTGGAQAEAYEGVLVQVTEVSVTSENPDDPAGDYGEFEVEGCLRVDDLFFDSEAIEINPTMNTEFATLTGPMYYGYDNPKLCPRTVNDLVE